MARKVTEQEKEKMWRLYQETPCFSKVAKRVKRDPATVSKYVREYEAAVRAAGVVMHAKEMEIAK